ncbi:MAG TPA: pyridoxal 5'-phosphate synthase glutaminase subunit PdxT [Planktothrix sp.]|jgi:5'-phosphate synthase pdxT subunit
MKPTIGVLALQGDFREHARALTRCGAGTIEVRHSHQLDRVDGLVIPGGESTAIDTLCKDNLDPIFARIKQLGASGLPIYGTCMGSIFLATEIEGSTQGRLALMDIKVRRNAFGPQRYSFETDLAIEALGSEPYPAVFIRAPMILSCGSRVQVLAELEDGIAMARQGNLLVTTFHPEITSDSRVHQYFVDMVQAQRQTTAVQAPQLVAV